MEIITLQNLHAYLFEISEKLNWNYEYHAEIYHDVANRQSVDDALDILEERVKPWFIRNGWMHQNWREMVIASIDCLKNLSYSLNDLANENKLNEVIEALKPLGQIKQVSTGSDNYVAASKMLNFIFPNLIPKIDIYWIKNICLRKVNRYLGSNRFHLSGFIDLQLYRQYLQLGAEQRYESEVLGEIEEYLDLENAYAVVYEYCLLGFSREEILKNLLENARSLDAAGKGEPEIAQSKLFSEEPNNLYSIEYHRNWLTSDVLKKVFDEIRQSIMEIGTGIKETPTKQYIGYKYRGKLFGWITVYKKTIELGAYTIDEQRLLTEKKLRIANQNEDYTDILNSMSNDYRYLGG